MFVWAVLHGKNFNVGHYTQIFQRNIFIPAMPIGTVEFYHFIPLSLILTLTGDLKVNAKQKLLAYFLAHFSAVQDEI